MVTLYRRGALDSRRIRLEIESSRGSGVGVKFPLDIVGGGFQRDDHEGER